MTFRKARPDICAADSVADGFYAISDGEFANQCKAFSGAQVCSGGNKNTRRCTGSRFDCQDTVAIHCHGIEIDGDNGAGDCCGCTHVEKWWR